MQKMLNFIFRIVIFISFAVSALTLVFIGFKSFVSINELDGLTKTFVSDFSFGLECFYATVFFTVLSIVLSLCCIKSAKIVYLCFRTSVLCLVLFLQISSFKLVNTFYSVFNTLNKYDFETEIDLKGTTPSDVGLTQNQLDVFEKAALSKDNSVVFFALAIVLAAFVFLILTFTSIYNLLKNKKLSENSGV